MIIIGLIESLKIWSTHQAISFHNPPSEDVGTFTVLHLFILSEAFKTQTAVDGAQLIKVTSICRVKAYRRNCSQRPPPQKANHSKWKHAVSAEWLILIAGFTIMVFRQPLYIMHNPMLRACNVVVHAVDGK